jgi:hypothetical protein
MDVMKLESVMSTAIPQSKDFWQREERNNNQLGRKTAHSMHSFPKMGCLVGVESYQG